MCVRAQRGQVFSVWYFVLTVVQSCFYVLEFVLNLTKAVICLWKF